MSQSESLIAVLINLRDAGRKVLNGLNARIDAAPSTAKPVFSGIVDLHDELNRADELLARPSTADRGGEVEVRALEWREEAIPPTGECLASTVVGLYSIPLGRSVFVLRFRDKDTLGKFPALEAAKAAAQADYTARIRSALATTAGEAKWFAASVPPSIPVGTQRSFIVAVRRAHSGKVYSFPAIYLNGYQLVYETGECPKGNGCEGNGCDDGCPTTGWYSDSSEGEYDHNYAKLALAPGDEFLAWSPIQQFDPDRVALATTAGEATDAEWQTMDGAPKDGSRLWLANPQMQEPVIGQWDDYRTPTGKVIKEWIVTHDPHERFQPLRYGTLISPTRWQPLPAALTQTERE